MSETVRSFGYMACLTKPIAEEDFEELNEALYELNPQLSLNYTGDLIFSDMRGKNSDIYGITFGGDKMEDHGFMTFVEKCRTAGYEVDIGTVRPYSCIWYNGADSDMSLMDKSEFLKS